MVEKRTVSLCRKELEDILISKTTEVARLPEHNSGGGWDSFQRDAQGRPVVRLEMVNCLADMDIWQGLRDPAQAGLYPIGLGDIWAHYAVSNIASTQADGSPNPLAMPEPFEQALKRYKRAVIISAMLAMNPEIYEAHAVRIEQGIQGSQDDYCRAREQVGDIINMAVGRLCLELMQQGRAVVPMTCDNADKVIEGTRSKYQKEDYNGPCNSHYPQASISVMTGLMQFGICRLPFRDELGDDGKVQRLLGQYASVVIFDNNELITNGTDGLGLLDYERLNWLHRVNDYSNTDDEVVAARYCTYNQLAKNGKSICGVCIEACPAGALEHSSPGPDGKFSEELLRQKHRFSGDVLDFDYGNCSRERSQKTQLYSEYVCARCEAICAARGLKKPARKIENINTPDNTSSKA